MPLGASQRKLSFNNHNNNNGRHLLVERCSTLRACESCKRKKRVCNGQRPCSHCSDSKECIYSVVSDHARGVFTTSTARRLSSGSACETCRRRKTKCDGGSPCGYCAANQIDCINNSERRKRSLANIHQYQSSTSSTSTSTSTSTSSNNNLINNQPILSSPLSLSSSTSTINMKSKNNNKNNKKLQLSSSTTTSSKIKSSSSPPTSTSSIISFSSLTSPTSSSPSTSSSTSSSTVMTPLSASFIHQTNNIEGNQTMDRIEDRLSRIEKLMKAFSPTHSLSQTSSYQDMLLQQSTSTSTAIRKMSSPVHSTFQKQHHVRPHRHSVQGITVAKEKAELKSVLNHQTYSTPPNSKSSLSSTSSSSSSSTTTTTNHPSISSSSSSSSLSNTNSNHQLSSNKLTHSMLNLTLSPSSSSSSSTTNMPPSSTSFIYQTHPSQPYCQKDLLNRSPSPEGDWKSPIPSLMDQLSQRTFHSNAMDYTVQYPIYPLTPSPPNSDDQ